MSRYAYHGSIFEASQFSVEPKVPQFSGLDYQNLIDHSWLRQRVYGPITNYPVGLVEDISRRQTMTERERDELEAFLAKDVKPVVPAPRVDEKLISHD